MAPNDQIWRVATLILKSTKVAQSRHISQCLQMAYILIVSLKAQHKYQQETQKYEGAGWSGQAITEVCK